MKISCALTKSKQHSKDIIIVSKDFKCNQPVLFNANLILWLFTKQHIAILHYLSLHKAHLIFGHYKMGKIKKWV